MHTLMEAMVCSEAPGSQQATASQFNSGRREATLCKLWVSGPKSHQAVESKDWERTSSDRVQIKMKTQLPSEKLLKPQTPEAGVLVFVSRLQAVTLPSSGHTGSLGSISSPQELETQGSTGILGLRCC